MHEGHCVVPANVAGTTDFAGFPLPHPPDKPPPCRFKVAAFYQFAALPDFRELREPLRAICAGLGLKGSVLLAHEGINGTVAGSEAAIDAPDRGVAAMARCSAAGSTISN